MKNKNLLRYIETNLKRGFSRETIHSALAKSGYDSKIIIEHFQHLEKRKGKKNKKLLIIFAFLLILILIISIGIWLMDRITPKTILNIEQNNLTNLFQNELLYDTELIDTGSFVYGFLAECEGLDEIQKDGSPKCNPYNLFILVHKLKNYEEEQGKSFKLNPGETERITKILLNSKSNLVNQDKFSVNSSTERILISSLKYFDLISEEELIALSDKYFSSNNIKFVEENRCFMLYEQQKYLISLYELNYISEAKESKLEYAKTLSAACQEADSSASEQFCRESNARTDIKTHICNYWWFLDLKYYCQNINDKDWKELDEFIKQNSNLPVDDGYCIPMLKIFSQNNW